MYLILLHKYIVSGSVDLYLVTLVHITLAKIPEKAYSLSFIIIGLCC